MTERLVYTVPEAADALGVHPQTLRAAIARGEIVGVRVGRRVLVPRAALEAALAGGNGREPPDVNGPARKPARTDEERNPRRDVRTDVRQARASRRSS